MPVPDLQDDSEVVAPDLREYGRTLWKRRWIIVLTTAVAVGLAIGYSAVQSPTYQATADIVIQPSATASVLNSTQQNAQDAARHVDTEVAVLKSSLVMDAAKQRLGHKPDITITSSATSDVVHVHARSDRGRRAATDASGYAAEYVALRRAKVSDDLARAGFNLQARVDQLAARIAAMSDTSPELAVAQQQQIFLQQQLDQLQVYSNLNQVGGASVLATAEVPTTPVSPRPFRNVAIAVALGLLLGIGLVFLREHLDDTIATREQLEHATGLPVLAQIPRAAGSRAQGANRVVTRDEPTSPAAEAYRSLRTAVAFLTLDRELGSIQVTSAHAGEGKTTVLANLAIALARSGRSVTIVSCDLRRPRIHELFDVQDGIGFTSLLLGEASVLDALQRVPGEPNVTVVPAGPRPPNPSELLSSPQVPDVLSAVASVSDVLLIDSPPVLPMSDALVVSRMVDATILVASTKGSSRRAIRHAVAVLRQVDAPLVGTVLNNANEGNESYGAYGSGNAVPVDDAEPAAASDAPTSTTTPARSRSRPAAVTASEAAIARRRAQSPPRETAPRGDRRPPRRGWS